MEKFGPAAVRRRLEKIEPDLMIADKDWYGDLSERFTHPSPGIRPGHYEEGVIIGGSFQEAGLKKAIGEISTVLGHLALLVCKFEKFDDLFELLAKQATSDANL